MIIEDEKKQMCELSHTKSNKVDVMTDQVVFNKYGETRRSLYEKDIDL